MLQSQTQDSFDSIISLSETLCNQVNNMDAVELKKKIADYNQKIEKHFELCKTEDFTEEVQNELKQLISTHEKMIDFFSKEKEKLSKNIKRLHAGKKIKNTYS